MTALLMFTVLPTGFDGINIIHLSVDFFTMDCSRMHNRLLNLLWTAHGCTIDFFTMDCARMHNRLLYYRLRTDAQQTSLLWTAHGCIIDLFTMDCAQMHSGLLYIYGLYTRMHKESKFYLNRCC